jgi:hypothetical protein
MLIEQTIIDYLLTEDALLPVYAEYPQNPPEHFIIIERTSSDESDFVRNATVAIQTISDSLHDAARMCEWIKTIMGGMPDAVENVFSCRLNSAYNFTDTDTKQYRYQSVFDITYQDD